MSTSAVEPELAMPMLTVHAVCSVESDSFDLDFVDFIRAWRLGLMSERIP
jgi:hypothetical protein